ncbi:hypothetical protein H5410_020989 [Solanum commersonii]|uniref:Uncharacterized protein n=1 Tax=Solanum commersonii TaxID=4109 RepID=A0A9J5ZDV9_SOLCO|nr:hypothetical protein H5410_020989 [Solanum commersonii]
MCLGDFSLVFIKQCYNSRAFQSKGFVYYGSSWLLKTDFDELGAKHEKLAPSTSTSVSTAKLTTALENLDAMHAKLDAMSITVSQVSDVMTKIIAMGEHVDSLKDLFLAAHFKIDNVKDISIEIGVDVAMIRAISTSLSSRFEEMSIAIVSTLTYFLKPR